MTKKTKKNKEVTKEVLKEDEKWYGLEKKFWSVVEFGVYVVLLTFTAIAIGAQYQSLEGDKNVIIDEGSKEISIAGMDVGTTYLIESLCNEVECENTFKAQYIGKEVEIKYDSTNEGTTLTIGEIKIENANPLKEFVLLTNGYIVTVENVNGNASKVTYYDTEGNEVHSYTTVLDVTDSIATTKSVYGTCDASTKTLNVVEYEIACDGTFNENIIGTFENSNCQD